jgi:DNA-binding transcriptional LysR family regulator
MSAQAMLQPIHLGDGDLTPEPSASPPRPAPLDRWQSVEVRHLLALAAVARHGSFRRAADQLGYVQSAISSQVAQLERAAGIRLLDRSSGSSTVVPTAAGHVLLKHAGELLARLAAAHDAVSSLAHEQGNVVRIAGVQQLGRQVLGRALRTFRERYPSVRIASEDTDSLERLHRGEVDLAVGEPALVDGPFAYVVLDLDPYALLVRSDSPLLERPSPPTPAELSQLNLIIPINERRPTTLETALRALGVRSRSAITVQSVALAQSLVGAGLGEAIAPRLLLDPVDPRTIAIDLPTLPPRELALFWHAERDHPTTVYGLVRALTVACKAERSLRDVELGRPALGALVK